ncbi:MAG TPA: RDD family protein [Thermoanaerobaculia bacterium]|nr:RDD family protein [Thermoanaerobaculia bacterium]
MLWYYAKGDQRFGPLEETELRRLIAAGGVLRTDLVWREGLPAWLQAGSLESFFPPARPPMPAPVAPYSPEPVLPQPSWQPAQVATEYAGLGVRFGAFLLDTLLTMGIGFVCGIILGVMLAASGSHWSDEAVGAFAYLMGIVVAWLYYTLFESSALMATPGKRALGLRVTDLQGRRIGFGRANGRYFGKILSLIAMGFGYWTIPSSPMRQGWHDKMAGSLVLRTR